VGARAAEKALVVDSHHAVSSIGISPVREAAEQLDVALPDVVCKDDKQDGIGCSLTRISNTLDKHDNANTTNKTQVGQVV